MCICVCVMHLEGQKLFYKPLSSYKVALDLPSRRQQQIASLCGPASSADLNGLDGKAAGEFS